jgi:hypothetical protein
MEASPTWRVRCADTFEDDRAAITEDAEGRVDDIIASWMWELARLPFRVSRGLSSRDDDTRVVSDIDWSIGTELRVSKSIANGAKLSSHGWTHVRPVQRTTKPRSLS